MIDVWSIFLLGTLACEVALVVVIARFLSRLGGFKFPVALLKELIHAWSERRVAPVDSESTGQRKSEGGGKVDDGVGELPPEVIAPSLKKPPRPQGGFGSRVGKSDGDT